MQTWCKVKSFIRRNEFWILEGTHMVLFIILSIATMIYAIDSASKF
ncbi:hypothetical protein LCGC14_0911580 [marine sediment metagenome]|uniref:Uncharacterized protein n=1 Tax=marine sediment metagenome TaxID=412755 RepID=A0A0F9RCH7_9ZZZZ